MPPDTQFSGGSHGSSGRQPPFDVTWSTARAHCPLRTVSSRMWILNKTAVCKSRWLSGGGREGLGLDNIKCLLSQPHTVTTTLSAPIWKIRQASAIFPPMDGTR